MCEEQPSQEAADEAREAVPCEAKTLNILSALREPHAVQRGGEPSEEPLTNTSNTSSQRPHLYSYIGIANSGGYRPLGKKRTFTLAGSVVVATTSPARTAAFTATPGSKFPE